MDNLKQRLTNFGFTSIEADVYLGLLASERAKVGEITDETGITRTQLYPLLHRMLRKGFIIEVGTSPSQYRAVDPSKLISRIYDNKQDEIRELMMLKSRLERIRPVKQFTTCLTRHR